MTKTSNAVKDRWNAKAYDDLRIRIPKGRKADILAYIEKTGDSINGLVNGFFCNLLGTTDEEWKRPPEEK